MLIEFYKQHGHCEIPTSNNRPLAEWTQRQRREYRNRHEFIEKHNGEIDPDNHRKPDNLKINNNTNGWDPKKGTMMTSDRIEALEKVDGWFWTIKNHGGLKVKKISNDKAKAKSENDNNITL